MKKAKTTSTPIQYLPDELLVRKLTKVAFRSFKDLFSAKVVCKKFNQISQDDLIFEHINIRGFEGFDPLTSWNNNEDVSKFLKRCMECDNSDALYMLGMTYFFQDNKKKARIEALKMAISKAHEVATYVYGVISVCYRGGSKHEGLKILYSLNPHKLGRLSVMECREMVHQSLSGLWVDREVIGEILQFHNHNATMNAYSDCGSPQGPFTI